MGRPETSPSILGAGPFGVAQPPTGISASTAGSCSTNFTRIGKGEYSQMMRTLNFDHHEAKDSLSKGQRLQSVSEKTRREREKCQQYQQNQANENFS